METRENLTDDLLRLIHELPEEAREALAAELEPELRPLIQQRIEEVVHVRSAIPLTEEEQAILREGLSRRFEEESFNLDLEVDPSLIGGLVVEAKGLVMDFSVAGKLEALRGYLISLEGSRRQ